MRFVLAAAAGLYNLARGMAALVVSHANMNLHGCARSLIALIQLQSLVLGGARGFMWVCIEEAPGELHSLSLARSRHRVEKWVICSALSEHNACSETNWLNWGRQIYLCNNSNASLALCILGGSNSSDQQLHRYQSSNKLMGVNCDVIGAIAKI